MRTLGGIAGLVAVVAIAVAGCSSDGNDGSGPTASSSGSRSSEYDAAYAVGVQAYTYGLPLITTDLTFQTMTSVDVSQGAYGPVNQFNHVRSPNTSKSSAVVAPGASSLSSIAWLDLSDQPQVLHVPQVTTNYFVLALIDPYTTNLRNFSTAAKTEPGDYVIAGPGQWEVPIPSGTTRVTVDYSRIWIIGSTQLKGLSDVPVVNAIQDLYTLTPLDEYGRKYSPPTPSPAATQVTKHQAPTGLEFFDAVGAQLTMFPPPRADEAALATFATYGIGPGLSPSTDSTLSADAVAGLTDAVSDGASTIAKETQSLYAAGFDKHSGYLLGGFGTYGTDYVLRSAISQIGLGAFVPEQAVYAMGWSDSTGTPLDGSSSYVLHLETPPPTGEGWSVTVYSLQGGLMPNALGRSAFTDSSPLTRNSDGSVDIYLQADQPKDAAKAANWLPILAGQGFEATWRLFAPDASQLDGILDGSGWQPPAVQRATGSASESAS